MAASAWRPPDDWRLHVLLGVSIVLARPRTAPAPKQAPSRFSMAAVRRPNTSAKTTLMATTTTPKPVPRPKAAASTSGQDGAKAMPTAPAASRAVAAPSRSGGQPALGQPPAGDAGDGPGEVGAEGQRGPGAADPEGGPQLGQGRPVQRQQQPGRGRQQHPDHGAHPAWRWGLTGGCAAVAQRENCQRTWSVSGRTMTVPRRGVHPSWTRNSRPPEMERNRSPVVR